MAADGYSIFGLFFIAMLFKGVLVSIAGPAPNYDMQRILAAKTPREAALMSAVVSAALLPRWLMIGGITMLALHYRDTVFPGLGQPGFKPDFEMILPWVIRGPDPGRASWACSSPACSPPSCRPSAPPSTRAAPTW